MSSRREKAIPIISDMDGVLNDSSGDAFREYHEVYLGGLAEGLHVPREELVGLVGELTAALSLDVPLTINDRIGQLRTCETTTWHQTIGALLIERLRGEGNHRKAAGRNLPEPGIATAALLSANYVRCREQVTFPLRHDVEDFLAWLREGHLVGKFYVTILSSVPTPLISKTLIKAGLPAAALEGLPLLGDAGKLTYGSSPLALPPGMDLPRTVVMPYQYPVEIPLWNQIFYSRLQEIGRAAFGLPPGTIVDFREHPACIIDDQGIPLVLANMLGLYALLFHTPASATIWEQHHYANTLDNTAERRHTVNNFDDIKQAVRIWVS